MLFTDKHTQAEKNIITQNKEANELEHHNELHIVPLGITAGSGMNLQDDDKKLNLAHHTHFQDIMMPGD